MATDTDDADVDPAELRRQLTQIEEAVGLKEEYGTVVEMWLFLGVLVAVASALSQYVYTEGLGGQLYAVIWLGVFVAGFSVFSYWTGGGNPYRLHPNRPNVHVVIGVTYLAAFPLLVIVGEFTRDLSAQEAALLPLAVISVLLGASYVVSGHVLRAHHIRDRDRYPFFVGGVGLAALGVALATVDALAEWPYVAFGGGYLVYAVATYVYLSGSPE